MAIPKTPLFSLGATGSLGGVVTHQRRGTGHIARTKPTPTNPHSLPQKYQRWLYLDYISRWSALSSSARQAWETLARRQHMTGFAFFMSDRLSTKADIRASWHLDLITNGQVLDSSKNSNSATVFGTIPAPGIIGQCLSFDGVDDRLQIPISSSLTFTTTFGYGIYIKPLPTGDYATLLFQHNFSIMLLITDATNIVDFYLDGIVDFFYVTTHDLWDGLWHHIYFWWDDSIATNNMRVYIDGTLDNQTTAHGTIIAPVIRYYIGRKPAAHFYPFKGLIDWPQIHVPPLEPSAIFNHALRRYP